ncbi:PTS system D-fructose-specific IIA component (F1P-forming) (Frc family) /PTS system D-fructose-specific IIB component (F1P-forming) (Frc family) /PTS system D-fructose-specific IIC component (F1P-forming) (Frc family) [Streptomyces sp. 2333.5]|uniref:PTS fructose transporter subunit IIABC n=1 Tax=unclassified Streptomyces TaxID=2593676 RepID=UPI0008997AB0|nr:MULTISPECIES: fructose-specific PTS transporter subunit EIIC [unclassified Streptomyces]PJJ02545.1 PTS system D-fructose-specific IIA component (F1P-forming) (Frc family) /PTS system D-fructose-specific IIB component (F1P-forming) (Frc family) /PTS system D-fructose-specific IIC component (F1P-forming) (Frc family) [Streptomyces sp. 2333.5]SED15037.1 PTS system D-fructose-specific IIA component (F1P-forming), Frc family /PTS system D-fructose-specific IIB component (F1P-forming), Frc family /P
MSELITAELVDLDLSAETKDAAARALAERMVAAGRVTDLAGFLADVAAREAQMPTGLDGGIGIPHCRSTHVTEPTLAFGRSAAGIDFGAPDGPADLIFLIAAPAGGDADHLSILSTLARQLMDETFTGALRSATESERTAALIRGDEAPAEPAPEQTETEPEPAAETADMATAAPQPPAETSAAPAGQPTPADQPAPAPFRIVAVTSCPTGIAHTYMAAESLEQAGKAAGVEVAVETQGSAGFQRLDPQLVADADGVIFAHDVEVRDKERFAGKPTVDVGVKAGIGRAADLIAEVRRKAALGEGSAPARAAAPMDKDAEPGDGFATRLRKWLMTGVSYMVPFVAAGGLLIALAFAIGGYTINKAPSVADHFLWTESTSWAALLFQIGTVAFGFLVPVLAGFIAYGMADRPGLVPGFVGGAIALTVNAGFLGGLIAGLLAGAVVMTIQRVRIPAPLRGIMPVVVIPLLSSVVVGFLMFLVVGKPIAALQKGLTDWLSGLTGANAVILGALLGLMMCFDLGGPLNKVAYAFAVGGLANPNAGSLKVMAAVMAAGMVPPLAMALATTVRGRLFTKAERENGKAAWVLGASFITEGAIPFAAADPLRVIPSAMAGGAVTGALSMAFGCTLRAPHGGIFVVPLIGQPLLYLLAIAAGTGVSTALVILLKGLRKRPDTRPADSPAPDGAGVTVAA